MSFKDIVELKSTDVFWELYLCKTYQNHDVFLSNQYQTVKLEIDAGNFVLEDLIKVPF